MGLGIMVCFTYLAFKGNQGLTETSIANQAHKLFYNGTSQETIETTDVLGIDCKKIL